MLQVKLTVYYTFSFTCTIHFLNSTYFISNRFKSNKLSRFFYCCIYIDVSFCSHIVSIIFSRKRGSIAHSRYSPGPGCSKLTTSLVNISLKFQMLISEMHKYFLLKKCEKLLQCKSFSHFVNKKYRCIWL